MGNSSWLPLVTAVMGLAIVAGCGGDSNGPLNVQDQTALPPQFVVVANDEVCEVADFNGFSHGDNVNSVSALGITFNLASTSVVGGATAKAFDTEFDNPGVDNDLQVSPPTSAGVCDDCAGQEKILVIGHPNFNNVGDVNAPGSITFTRDDGGEFRVTSFLAFDQEPPGGIRLSRDALVGDGGTAVTTFAESLSGNGEVVAVVNGDVVPGATSDTWAFEFTESGAIDDIELCAICTGKIGDLVWHDENENGIQNLPPEVGLADIEVILKDGVGAVIAMTTTAADGSYLFEGLCAGDYIVEVNESTLPAGFFQTPTEVGGNPANDNNPNPSDVTLTTDFTEDLTHDFGYAEEPPPDDCADCKGGVIQVTLSYDGLVAAMVTVMDSKETYFGPTLLNPGDQFTINGTKSDGKFEKNDLELLVDGVLSSEMHVSCSKPIGPGSVFGDFTVIEAFSKDNPTVAICPADDDDGKSKKSKKSDKSKKSGKSKKSK